MRSILCTILRLLCGLIGCSRARSQLYFMAGTIKISGDNLMARISNEQLIEFGINPRTGRGNPAPLDGPAVFSGTAMRTSGESVDLSEAGNLEQLADNRARFTANAAFDGVVQLSVSADADMDPGEERHIDASGTLEIVRPEAQTLEIVFDEPQDQPAR